jgi:hypothetical protein
MSQKREIWRTGETLYSFPQDENGMYVKEGGIPDIDTKLDVKYEKEGRFSFRVASVELSNGTLEGRRCGTFDYSAKNLITITADKKGRGGSKKGEILENRREVVGEKGTLTWPTMGG